MLFGYARASTQDQEPALYLDALAQARLRIFTEKASDAQRKRPTRQGARLHAPKTTRW